MGTVTVSTSFDLQRQSICEDPQNATVMNPDGSLEEFIVQQLKRVMGAKQGSVVVEYMNAKAPVPPSENSFVMPRFTDFLVVRALAKHGLTFNSLADVFCGAGFVGSYFAKMDGTRHVYFIDQSEKDIRAAMTSFGLTMYNDETAAHSRAEKTTNGHEVYLQATDARFWYRDVHDSLRRILDHRAIEGFVSSAHFIPKIHTGLSHYAIVGSVARNKCSKFVFAYSSLAEKLVRHTAKDLGASFNRLEKHEMPLVFDTSSGPKVYPLDARLVRDLTPLGLIDNGKGSPYRYSHEWCVGLMKW